MRSRGPISADERHSYDEEEAGIKHKMGDWGRESGGHSLPQPGNTLGSIRPRKRSQSPGSIKSSAAANEANECQ